MAGHLPAAAACGGRCRRWSLLLAVACLLLATPQAAANRDLLQA